MPIVNGIEFESVTKIALVPVQKTEGHSVQHTHTCFVKDWKIFIITCNTQKSHLINYCTFHSIHSKITLPVQLNWDLSSPKTITFSITIIANPLDLRIPLLIHAIILKRLELKARAFSDLQLMRIARKFPCATFDDFFDSDLIAILHNFNSGLTGWHWWLPPAGDKPQ